ncbi:MAG: diguanylate cyclase [Syntrophotaleaceae bacterium]
MANVQSLISLGGGLMLFDCFTPKSVLKTITPVIAWCSMLVLGLSSSSAQCAGQVLIDEQISGPASIQLSVAEKSWLAQDHEVRVRVGNWPPFMMVDGKVRGIAIDSLESIFSRHGIRHRFVLDTVVSCKEALEALKNRRQVDLVPTAKITAERQEYMIFSDKYLFLPWVIFARIDSPFIGGIDDLKGKTVSVPEGYVMQSLLMEQYPEIKLRVIDGDNVVSRCLKALAVGEVDAYIGNLAVGSYLIQNQGYANVKVASPTPFGSHDNAMGIRSDWPELAGIINKTLATFTPEEKAAIWNRWFSVRYEHGLGNNDVLKWSLLAAGSVGVFLLVVLLWNKRLLGEINMRKTVEARLRESEMKFKSLSEAAFEGIVIAKEGVILEVNESYARMFGYPLAEMIGKKSICFVAPEDRENVHDKIMRGVEGVYEVVCQKKDGSVFPAEIHARMFDYQGQRVRVTAIRDISVRKQAEKEQERFVAELEKLATTDGLTGILNRKAFFRRLEEEVERCKRYGHNLSLAMLDLDRFKTINDQYGHPAGDTVLQTFAARISANIRNNDIFGRIGGEEFAILLPETTLKSATIMIEKLRQMTEVSDITLSDGQRLDITVSAGVATSEDADLDIDQIVKGADRRLYLAKNRGRNCVVSMD